MEAALPGRTTIRRHRWLMIPTGCAVAAAVVMLFVRQRRRRVAVPAMSEAWLRNYEYAAGHHG
jgi:hypothetical protein